MLKACLKYLRTQKLKLKLLGKISDVGLFSEKTEINVNHNSPEDLEDQIKSKIYKLLGEQKTIDTSFETIEEELGEIEDKPDDEVK